MPLALKKNSRYTYTDYLSWPDEERWEIIDGQAYNMSPAPKPRHQRVVWNISGVLDRNKDKLKGCFPFFSPTDIVFDKHNVLQPDVFVVCDKGKIAENNIEGAPDLIFEVISPSTELKDKKEKKALYERFGVKEYLLVHPEAEYVEKYILENGKYGLPELLNWNETLKLHTFEIEINLSDIFEKTRE
ncbi:MAG: Uma2 family endonuclease [Dissulfurispiraceae bacterium]|jgi:Uma2 family endonuclease